MNKPITLKSLSILTFVIFLLPFMRTCSDDSINFMIKEPVSIDSIENATAPHSEDYLLAVQEKREIYTFNFYTLSIISFDSIDSLVWRNFLDLFFWAFLGFSIIMVLSLLILIFSFNKNRFKLVGNLCVMNIFILLFSTISLCYTADIEQISQIKIGYYLFVLNTLAILYFSKKNQVEKDRLR